MLWNELEVIASKYSGLSEQHRILFELINHAASQSPSCQNMKSIVDKKEGILETNRKVTEETANVSNPSSAKPTQSLFRTKGQRATPYPIPGPYQYCYKLIIYNRQTSGIFIVNMDNTIECKGFGCTS